MKEWDRYTVMLLGKMGKTYKKRTLNYRQDRITKGLVWFYGISLIIDYLMPNPIFTHILNIYDL